MYENIDDFINGVEPKKSSPKKSGFVRPGKKKLTDIPIGVNLVDYSQICISTLMATYKPTDEIDCDMIRHLILNTLRANVMKSKKTHPRVILCIDNGQGGYWRKKLASYYKSRRKKNRDKSGWDFDSLFKYMKMIEEEIIENLPYIVMNIPGMEADDHIGILTKYYLQKGAKVKITSSDGDFTQLHVNKDVTQWSPIQSKWVKPKHGSPQADLRFKCLKGDSKDGIASIKCPSDHYAQEDAPRATPIRKPELDEWMGMKESDLLESLDSDMKARYLENKKLLDLTMIPDNLVSQAIERHDNYMVPTRSKILPYFAKHKLAKLIPNTTDF